LFNNQWNINKILVYLYLSLSWGLPVCLKYVPFKLHWSLSFSNFFDSVPLLIRRRLS
jgi:hypothetical protein